LFNLKNAHEMALSELDLKEPPAELSLGVPSTEEKRRASTSAYQAIN
jgi:hypothetical protein